MSKFGLLVTAALPAYLWTIYLLAVIGKAIVDRGRTWMPGRMKSFWEGFKVMALSLITLSDHGPLMLNEEEEGYNTGTAWAFCLLAIYFVSVALVTIGFLVSGEPS